MHSDGGPDGPQRVTEGAAAKRDQRVLYGVGGMAHEPQQQVSVGAVTGHGVGAAQRGPGRLERLLRLRGGRRALLFGQRTGWVGGKARIQRVDRSAGLFGHALLLSCRKVLTGIQACAVASPSLSVGAPAPPAPGSRIRSEERRGGEE